MKTVNTYLNVTIKFLDKHGMAVDQWDDPFVTAVSVDPDEMCYDKDKGEAIVHLMPYVGSDGAKIAIEGTKDQIRDLISTLEELV